MTGGYTSLAVVFGISWYNCEYIDQAQAFALLTLYAYFFSSLMAYSVKGLACLLNYLALMNRVASILDLPDHNMQRQDHGFQGEPGVKIESADFSWKSKINDSG